MKKFIAVSLVAVMLAACSAQPSVQTTVTGSGSATQTTTVVRENSNSWLPWLFFWSATRPSTTTNYYSPNSPGNPPATVTPKVKSNTTIKPAPSVTAPKRITAPSYKPSYKPSFTAPKPSYKAPSFKPSYRPSFRRR